MTDVYQDLVHELKKNPDPKASFEYAIQEIARKFRLLSKSGPNQPADGYELASLVIATADSAKDIAAACFIGTPVMVRLDQAEDAARQHKQRLSDIEHERAKRQLEIDTMAARDRELIQQGDQAEFQIKDTSVMSPEEKKAYEAEKNRFDEDKARRSADANREKKLAGKT